MLIKRLFAFLMAASFFFLPISAHANRQITEGNPSPFIRVENGGFMLGGEAYRALGACLYPAHCANYDYITRTVREAKANGLTMIRAVDLWEGVYGRNDDALQSDSVWKRVDWLMKVCEDYDMKVLLDLSAMRQFLYYSPERRDSYAPEVLPLWEETVTFVANRVNTFTGKVYKEDPVLFSYAIAGEPICYGGSLNDWSNGFFTSRSPEDIAASVFHVADYLRQADMNHLISAGGLLHLSPVDTDATPFYQKMWSYPNIDYAAIHIYPPEGEPEGEWANLAAYRQYSSALGKPLIVEEFGHAGRDPMEKSKYLAECYDRCFENDIPVVLLWNWSLGQSFDTFSHMYGVMEVIHHNARRWGYGEEFLPVTSPYVDGQAIHSFEDSQPLFQPNQSDPGYGGLLTVSNEKASEGEYALKIPLQFTEEYQWYWLNASEHIPVELTGQVLAADIYLPPDAPPLTVKFSLNGVQQQESSRLNNYLLPGQWNTVYAVLEEKETSPDGLDWESLSIPTQEGKMTGLGLLFINANSLYTGCVYVDNIRTGKLALFGRQAQELQITDVAVSAEPDGAMLRVDIRAAGGRGGYRHSFYLLREGRLYWVSLRSTATSFAIRKPEAGEYWLQVYVEDDGRTVSKGLPVLIT